MLVCGTVLMEGFRIMFRVTFMSTRCSHWYLEGARTVHPFTGEPPANQGTTFPTVDIAVRHVEDNHHKRNDDGYWQCFIIDAAGKRVKRGVRPGYGATGNGWCWVA